MVMRDSIHLLTWKLFDVETTQETPKKSSWKLNRPETQFKNTKKSFIQIHRQLHSINNHPKTPANTDVASVAAASPSVSWRRRSSGHLAYPPGWTQTSPPQHSPDTQEMGRAFERLGLHRVFCYFHVLTACQLLVTTKVPNATAN